MSSGNQLSRIVRSTVVRVDCNVFNKVERSDKNSSFSDCWSFLNKSRPSRSDAQLNPKLALAEKSINLAKSQRHDSGRDSHRGTNSSTQNNSKGNLSQMNVCSHSIPSSSRMNVLASG